jgi:hypothetical protein
LQALSRPDGWQWPLAREQRGELRGLMNTYLSHLTGHRLRLHSYLNGLAAAD